jgi:hypothetical protein
MSSGYAAVNNAGAVFSALYIMSATRSNTLYRVRKHAREPCMLALLRICTAGLPTPVVALYIHNNLHISIQ